ncbi:MAG: hypothetical protein HS118_13405 [Bacteroidia bacterium]|nr:hypothetical protein [Bacteroidia bacterium]
MQALGVNPDLILSGTTNSLVLLNSDTVCWHGIKIENQSNTQPALTQADNVFLALIDSSPNYLYDWHFVKSGQVIYPDGNIFGLTSALATGTSITGDFVQECRPALLTPLPYEVRLHYGWNWRRLSDKPLRQHTNMRICIAESVICESGLLITVTWQVV